MGENYSVAIDLGGTIIKIGLILDSEIVRFTTISSDSVKGLSHMLPKMEHAIDSLLSEEGISSTDLASIGLAFPGMVNPVECRVISTNDKYDDAVISISVIGPIVVGAFLSYWKTMPVLLSSESGSTVQRKVREMW